MSIPPPPFFSPLSLSIFFLKRITETAEAICAFPVKLVNLETASSSPAMFRLIQIVCNSQGGRRSLMIGSLQQTYIWKSLITPSYNLASGRYIFHDRRRDAGSPFAISSLLASFPSRRACFLPDWLCLYFTHFAESVFSFPSC